MAIRHCTNSSIIKTVLSDMQSEPSWRGENGCCPKVPSVDLPSLAFPERRPEVSLQDLARSALGQGLGPHFHGLGALVTRDQAVAVADEVFRGGLPARPEDDGGVDLLAVVCVGNPEDRPRGGGGSRGPRDLRRTGT